MDVEQNSDLLVAERGDAVLPTWLTLESLGARTMTPAELAELSSAPRAIAADADELRALMLQRMAHWRRLVPDRPTIGYYLSSEQA